MEQKKVVIFIDWYKPGFKAGGPIRSVSNMVDFLETKFQIYIITRNTDYLDPTPYPEIIPNKWQRLNNHSVIYLSRDKLKYGSIKKLVGEVNPEIIYCNSLYSPYFTLMPLFISKRLGIASVLAVRGMLSKGSLSVKNNKKKFFLALAKLFGIYKNCGFHATNEEEKKDIITVFGDSNKIVVAQNLPEKKTLKFKKKEKETGNLQLISVGRIAPEKNTLYAIKTLSKCVQLINFDIYGPIYDENYWNNCKDQINQLPDNIVVNYKGVLNPIDLDDTFKKYHALFLPSTGENYGHVIIEAMINSCLPIISDKTPWKNLERDKIGYDFSLDNQSAFSNTIDKVAVMNSAELNEITNKSHIFANRVIQNTSTLKDYDKLFST